MKTLNIFIFAIVLISAGQTMADSWFSDNFNDGTIDTTHWNYNGDGISESGGMLNINRNNGDDYIKTAYTYSGDFTINLDVRLNYINMNDVFHGITVGSLNSDMLTFTGISMGFSEWNRLYCAVPQGDSGINFYYGDSPTNTQGQWQHWTLTKNGNYLNILVNGLQVKSQQMGFTFGGTVPDTVSVYLPGIYLNLGSSGNGITSSSYDNFSITPEPATVLLLTLGGLVLRKRKA
jgi:hypothetical protein